MASLHPATYDLIKYYEGLYLDPYRDPVGLWTVGYGHLLSYDKTLPKPQRASLEQCEAWLASDLGQAQRLCTGLLAPSRAISPQQLGALTSFTFNLGSRNLAASTLLRKVNAGAPDDEIIFQLGRWDKAGGKKLKGLTRRRAAEAMLWLTGGFDPAQVDDFIPLFS